MFVNLLTSTLRTLARHRLYSAINILGLSLGIAVFLTLALIDRYELRYDIWVPHASSVYRVDMHWRNANGHTDESRQISFVPYPYLRDVPGIGHAARVLTMPTPVRVDGRVESETVTQTDPDLFSIFGLHVLSGDVRAMKGPRDVVIPRSAALRYFGTESAVGRILTIDNARDPSRVVAVYDDPPPNSSMDFGMIHVFASDIFSTLPFRNWGSSWGQIWVAIDRPRAVPMVASVLHGFVAAHRDGISPSEYDQYYRGSFLSLVPLRAVHFHDAAIGGGPSRELVAILGLIGLAALASGAINYINLATARAGLRAREVAMRKVLGASQRLLVGQFIGEAVGLVALAGLCGAALAEIALHYVNAYGGWAVGYDWLFVIPTLLLLVIVVGGFAGAYPAFVLARFQPAPVLAASRMPSGGRMGQKVRQGLVVVQFAFAITLAICTLVMSHQAAFVQAMARGMKQDGLIVIDSLSDSTLADRQIAIMDRLATVPGVTIATRSDIYPHHIDDRDSWHGEGQDHGFSTGWGYASPGYFATLGVRPIAGRLFDDAHGADAGTGRSHWGKGIRNVVISRSAARAFGFAALGDAVGRIVREAENPQPFRVIGVFDDLRLGGATDPLEPLALFYTREPMRYVAGIVRYQGADSAVEMQRLHDAWNAIVPDVPFSATTAADIFADDYRSDRDHGRLFAIGSGVAILIACLGLYGLASFNATRRLHEIGVRKVLGARTRDVLWLLVAQFARPVLLANLIAWPIAWALMRGWLAGFDQRIALTPAPFVMVATGALTIATATVLGQTIRVARAEPARALRAQ